MKTCYICKTPKSTTEFYTSGKTAAGYVKYSSRCKECDNKRTTSPTKLANHLVWRKKKQERDRLWLNDIKRTLSCLKCGFSFREKPWLLDFHHRDPSQKSFQIGVGPTFLKPREAILAEVAKCDPLCANCHRDFHYQQRHPTPTT